MLELLICSLFTILPDYLYRRYGQGKRIGEEITIFSVWFELRWGITGCVMLTVALITVIFYNHPTSRDVSSLFRTVPILPEAGGRVAEIDVVVSDEVAAGEPLFRLDDSSQRAALETATRRIAEIEAAMLMAEADLAAAEARIAEAAGALGEAQDELDTRLELQARNPDVVPVREIERLQQIVASRRGAVEAAEAARDAARARLDTLLPAQKASAEAARDEAQVALDKTVIRAGVDGRVEQFTLQVGDFVSPLMRPAGVLIPEGVGEGRLIAGFNQIEAQVIRRGMAAEVSCSSLPFTVIPMVVTGVQQVIAAGQIRVGERLIDPAQLGAEGTIVAVLEPIWEGGLDRVPPGSRCVANAYTSHHDRLQHEEMGLVRRIALHAVDTVAVVHAILLRIETLLLPVRTLVLGGH